MKRFRSRFERIQHVRQQQERLARATASARNGDVAAAEARRSQATHELDASLHSESRLLHDPLTAAILQAARARVDTEQRELQQTEDALSDARDRHRAALTEFETSRLNLKMVDSLVDRERREHARDTQRSNEADAAERAAHAYQAQRLTENGSPS